MPLKSCVFILFLKVFNILSIARNSDGSLFQYSLEPQTEKGHSPYEFILYRGRFSLIASVEERSDVLDL